MILVDTSIWVDLFSRKPKQKLSVEQLPLLATCSPVIQEVFQGLKNIKAVDRIQASFLSLPRLGDPTGTATYLHAADIYRQGRIKGYTIRSSVDCLIAAIAIENQVPVWHCDRDFTVISRYTALRVLTELPN